MGHSSKAGGGAGRAVIGLALAVYALPSLAAAQEGPVPFRKVLLNAQFYSEGINFGDLDRDGDQDIVAGPYWYPGPDFAEKRAFRQPRSTPFPVSGDSDCYAVFLHDFNGDGWPDILSFRLAGGAEAVWYENPKGGQGFWTGHVAHSAVENESAALLDVDGDGRPEIIANSKGFGGWVQPDWARPSGPWAFRSATAKQSWGAYNHGIGAGDVNGDGRTDLLFSNGWWEQPADPADTPWTHHAATFGGRANPSESLGGAQMRVYDVDGDGDNDVITSHQAHGWGLAWHENLGGGGSFAARLIMNTAAERATYGLAFSQLHALAFADLDGDGLEDIVTGKRKGAHGNGLGADVDSPAVLYWFRLTRPPGKPPRYVPYRIDDAAGVGTQVAVGDVNGDGSPDILTARREGAYVFLNQKTFPSSLGPLPPAPRARAAPWSRLWQGRWDALGRSPSRDAVRR